MDELQDALNSAPSDPIEELKEDLGMKEEVKEPAKAEHKAKVEKPVEDTAAVAEDKPKADSKSADSPAAESVEDSKPIKKSYQERKIERQTAANRKQLEKITELQQKLASYEQTAPTEQGPRKPVEDDFETYREYENAVDKYQEDLVEYKADKIVRERIAKAEQESQQRAENEKLQKLENSFLEREDKFKARHRNYDKHAEAVGETIMYLKGEGVSGVDSFSKYVSKSELGPNFVHHFGENPDLLESILAMDDVDIPVELYKIGLNLSNGTTESKKLPEPIKGLRTANSGSKSMVDMSYEELKANYKI